MTFGLATDKDYKAWLAEIKLRIRTVQIKAAVSVNSELLRFYWSLGAEIVVKQMTAKWGDGLLSQLSLDLTAEFPEMKGFSLSNLKYIKQWYLFYARSSIIGQQAVGQTIDPLASPSHKMSLDNRLLAKLWLSLGDTILQSLRNVRMSGRPYSTLGTRWRTTGAEACLSIR